MDFFNELEPLLRIFWYIAIPSSLIFIIQSIMTFIGLDASDGIEADFDGDLNSADEPFQLFSFRNLINFLLGFSWGGISFYSLIENKTVLIALAVVIGLAFIYLFFFIIKQIQRLAEDNTFKFEKVLNKKAEVYITIPEHKSGKGKVLVSLNGSVRELDAYSETERIPTGTAVKIIRIEDNSSVIVEKF